MFTQNKDTRQGLLWLPLMIGLWGLIMCSLVGAEGPVGWRILRIVIVAAVTSAAVLVTVRFPRWGAVIAILLSTTAFMLAVVFGLYWMLKAGFSWRVAAGILSLCDGVLLLILGSRQLVSGMSKWWLFLTVPLTVIIVPVMTWTMTQPVIATNAPHIPSGNATLQDYGLTAMEVNFTSADGVKMGGWYIPAANACGVVLRHGSGSTASDVLAQAAVLVKHGYGVLITDARGHGISQGQAMEFGWYGDADIIGAVNYLVDEAGIEAGRIAIVGMSMGGEEAIGAVAADKRIAAVVAEGATGRTDTDKQWLKDVYGFRGSIQMGLEWIEYSIADLLTGAEKPISLAEAIKSAAPHPVLLITAGKVEDELNAAKYLQQQSPNNVVIWTVPGAGHTQGLAVAPVYWEQNVIDFLDDALIK
jgi:uncharacterized protein